MLVNLIIPIWASVAFTIYWIDFARFPQRFRIFNFKPLNCEACLPVWLTPAFFALGLYSQIAVALIAATFTAGIITPILLKLIRK